MSVSNHIGERVATEWPVQNSILAIVATYANWAGDIHVDPNGVVIPARNKAETGRAGTIGW